MGGLVGAVGVGALRGLFHRPAPAFLLVFCGEALVFLISALLASGLGAARPANLVKAGKASVEFGGVRG
jgi:hypothetical protein